MINPVCLACSPGTEAGQTRSAAEATGMPGSMGESGGRAGAGHPDAQWPRWASETATERGREREESEWTAAQRDQSAASGTAPGGERYFSFNRLTLGDHCEWDKHDKACSCHHHYRDNVASRAACRKESALWLNPGRDFFRALKVGTLIYLVIRLFTRNTSPRKICIMCLRLE